MKQHTLQPKLRFPDFEGDWEKKGLKDIGTINRGKSKHRPRNDKRLYGGDIPFIQTGDVNNDKLYITEYTQTYTDFGLSQSKLWDENTLCITIAANIANTSILKFKSCFPDSLIGFIANDQSDIIFVKYTFDKIRQELKKLSQGVAQDNLNLEKLNSISTLIPCLPEQQKIADYLLTIDAKINLLEEKKEELSRYKKAMMQKLFSQEIRFKDDNGNDFADWEAFQLKDILIEHKEKNKGDKYDEVLSVAKMKGVINQIEHLGRSYSAEKIDHYKVINPFDIVYTKSPTSGFPFGIIKQNKLNRSGVLSPLYAVFKPKTKYIGMILHDIFLSEVETYNYLVPLVQKGAKNTMNINNDEFLKGKKYSLPTSELEQQKIANFLSAIDESIDKVSEQIKESQSFKKAMLQQMFV